MLKIKCRNINLYGDVPSDEMFQTVYDTMEEEVKGAKRKKSSASSSRKHIPEFETESEEEVIEEEEEEPESSSSSETSDEYTVTESFPIFQAEFRPYLQNFWDTMSPPLMSLPFPESDLKAAWHAAIFNVPKRKRGILYIGRITKSFLTEENRSNNFLELDCLKLASGLSSTILEEPPEHSGKYIDMFNAYDVTAGLLKIVSVEVRYFKTTENKDHKSLFEQQYTLN